MLDKLIGIVSQKALTVAAGVALTSGAAAGAFASQDSVDLFGSDPGPAMEALEVTETPTETPGATETPGTTETPAATGTPAATETPGATATPDDEDDDSHGSCDDASEDDNEDAADDAEDEDDADEEDDADDEDEDEADDDHGCRDTQGIPDDNPVFEENDDDECEKHESEVKTTPGGNDVMTPCKEDDSDGQGHHGSDDQGSDDEQGDD